MSKVDLDEIYNPSHKLKSNYYKTIHYQSLTDKKNKFFQNSILNLAKEKKKKVSGEELFQRLNDLRLKKQKNKKLFRIVFYQLLLEFWVFLVFKINT